MLTYNVFFSKIFMEIKIVKRYLSEVQNEKNINKYSVDTYYGIYGRF